VAQQDNELTGPDLAQGVPARDLQERTPLLGHAAGEAVLLTRCDGKVYATGATCTHYGAPLVDGIVEGGAIRCPWHHSAFSLATGAAVRPPGLSDLACWQVEERDGVIRVGARADVARAVATSDEKHPASVVIIGGGAAGLVAADTLRRERYRGPITMITADTVRPVDRPNLSKDYLAGNAPEEWIPLRPDAWYDEHGIDVRLGRRAVGLDPRARRVTLDDGSALDYGALLLSTGAEPIRLPLGDAPVHYLRTLHDCRAIIAATESAKRAVVIGASFIGLEVAASLRA
jgi:3-phenylpropionate/trans-cinnamate dioxygenase ferredoxin reductase subunit